MILTEIPSKLLVPPCRFLEKGALSRWSSHRLLSWMSATIRSLVGGRSRDHRHLKIVAPLRRDDLRDLHRNSQCQDSGRGLCPLRYPRVLARSSTMLTRELYGNIGVFLTIESSMENPRFWCLGFRRGNRWMNTQKMKWTGSDGSTRRRCRADDGEGRVPSSTFDSARGQIGISSLFASHLNRGRAYLKPWFFEFGIGPGHLTWLFTVPLFTNKVGSLKWMYICRVKLVSWSCNLHAKHGCGQE
jgi:hypothetical protein